MMTEVISLNHGIAKVLQNILELLTLFKIMNRNLVMVFAWVTLSKGDAAQAKLVRVLKGSVLDVAVDLRRSSPTFGKYVAVELSETNKRQLFIPRGFAHGFLVLSPEAIFCYKVDNVYAPDQEATLMWNDESVSIDWPIKEDLIF